MDIDSMVAWIRTDRIKVIYPVSIPLATPHAITQIGRFKKEDLNQKEFTVISAMPLIAFYSVGCY